MICKNCGNTLSGNANFCKKCGTAAVQPRALKKSLVIPVIIIAVVLAAAATYTLTLTQGEPPPPLPEVEHHYATALRAFFAGAAGHKTAVLVDLDGYQDRGRFCVSR